VGIGAKGVLARGGGEDTMGGEQGTSPRKKEVGVNAHSIAKIKGGPPKVRRKEGELPMRDGFHDIKGVVRIVPRFPKEREKEGGEFTKREVCCQSDSGREISQHTLLLRKREREKKEEGPI